ncbi:MAG: universal stress protein [Desulfobacterales bacterium]|nr:MAG: universal stress protein [Desulfobacterales bacterium]
MKKKLLIAVGDCIYSKQAVKYAARMTSGVKDVSYTLFNVQPLLPRIFRQAAETDPKVNAELHVLVEKNTEVGRCASRELKDIMVREGIPQNRVEVVSQPMQVGMAKDILNRAEQGSYYGIILARRALTPSRDFFIGTTAAKVVEHAIDIPVWVVDGKTISMRIMLAVDGSENSLRDIDHLINIIGANPDLKLTLFHVLPYLRHYYSVDFERENPRLQEVLEREGKRRMDDFYENAYQKLQAAGLTRDQIEMKARIGGYDISTCILEEARTGQYSTVVVGRRGERDAFFTGRIAMRLVQKVADQTLWVVP